MNKPPAPTHTDWLKIEAVLDRFEEAWQSDSEPRIKDYVADSAHGTGLLVELVKIDIEYRWTRGKQRRTEEYVSDFPELADAVAELKAEELRQLAGQPKKVSESQTARSTILLKPPGDASKRSRGDTPSRFATPTVELPQFLGPYEVRQKLGGGGFSTVYRGWDPELKREVAIKVPHPGLFDDPEGAARLLREASSAARLRHPAIVPLHQVVTDGPVTFLVYQFIPGPNLREVLKQTQPAPRQTAEWVARLADALAYAHDSGIIHRDVKPANILMDADGQPMLADFGLAMQTDASVKLTRLGDVLGTPAYMSPEQAGGGSHAVDVRTDVYSLGVVLYEMLCGRLPFTGNSTAMIQQVLRQEPPAPRQINPRVPLDLETICQKAMSKEPARRYRDAGELAADLRRYLRDEPIQARPIRTPERLWRWARRNPRVAVLVTALFTVLVAGLTAVTFFWRLADSRLDATDIANRQLKKQIEATDIANEELRKQKEAADNSSQQARAAVKDLFILATDHPTYMADGMQPARKLLLDSAMKYYREFIAQRQGDVNLREEIADAHDRLGDILDLVGTRKEAAIEYKRAQALYEDVLREKPNNERLKVLRAWTLAQQGCLELQTPVLAEGVRALEELVEIQQRQVEAEPNDPLRQIDLGRSWRKLGELQHLAHRNEVALQSLRKGRDILRAVIPVRPTSRAVNTMSSCCYLIGHVERILGKAPEAAEAFREAAVVQEKILASSPTNTQYRIELARIYGSLNLVLGHMGDHEAAKEAVQKAIELREKTVQSNPGVGRYRHDLAISYVNLASDVSVKEPDKSLTLRKQALDLLAELVRAEPEVAVYHHGLGLCHNALHYSYRQKGAAADATRHLQEACKAWEKAAELDPGHPEYRGNLAHHHVTVAETHRNAERFKEARDSYNIARGLFQVLDATDPGKPGYKSSIALVLVNLSFIEEQFGSREQSLLTQLEALAIRQQLAHGYPNVPSYKQGVERCLENAQRGTKHLVDAVIVASLLSQSEQSHAAARRAETVLGKLAKEHPEISVFQAELERLRAFKENQPRMKHGSNTDEDL